MIAFAAVIPLSGLLIDRVGRKPVMMASAFAFCVLSVPLFHGLQTGNPLIALGCHMTFGVIMGFYFAAIAAVLVEIFPTRIRYSGLSIAHNLSMTFFGGSAPFVVTWMIRYFDDLTMPAYYLVFAGAGSLVGLMMMKDRFREPLL